jgi:hypothetical protein
MSESELYEPSQKFIKRRYNCFFVATHVGKDSYGYADVFGIRYKNQEKSAIETIGVEVKSWKQEVCRSFGQAKGYSVFCHRIYYAVPKTIANIETFSEEDKEIAKYLGIGLIEMRNRGSGYFCREVLEAPENLPLSQCLDTVLKTKKVNMPQFCSKKEYRFKAHIA